VVAGKKVIVGVQCLHPKEVGGAGQERTPDEMRSVLDAYVREGGRPMASANNN
jgi:hypothetical protein